MSRPIYDDGVNEGENLSLACRNALWNMLALLQERGRGAGPFEKGEGRGFSRVACLLGGRTLNTTDRPTECYVCALGAMAATEQRRALIWTPPRGQRVRGESSKG
jgi:hypothetical protein